ncbi:hypothetical protein [Dermatobacter hominis]|uniref:hypothetical protein n=1 Tax=Dermatobacter hominis TaxID=2884263 RepID=UPI001D0FF248|nr:hypothetical protein [Dermatobacter hominis]UDY33989.1 hypothetical protein LH044_11595 [Dermatobacter hominis]
MSNRWKLRLLGIAAVVLVVIGIVLVVTGGDDEPAGPSTTTTTAAEGQAPRATLPLDDTSTAGVSALAGLTIPDGVADFLSAGTEDRAQLDVTFTLPTDQVATFTSGSGFPTLVEGDQVITHSSPLWKVNPGGTVSGAADTFRGDDGSVARAVETVPEGDRVRVRLVISPAG